MNTVLLHCVLVSALALGSLLRIILVSTLGRSLVDATEFLVCRNWIHKL